MSDDGFFDRAPTDLEVRTAFEDEMRACHAEGRPFDLLAFIEAVPGTDIDRLAAERRGLRVTFPPGVYRQPADGNGGWVSGSC